MYGHLQPLTAFKPIYESPKLPMRSRPLPAGAPSLTGLVPSGRGGIGFESCRRRLALSECTCRVGLLMGSPFQCGAEGGGGADQAFEFGPSRAERAEVRRAGAWRGTWPAGTAAARRGPLAGRPHHVPAATGHGPDPAGPRWRPGVGARCPPAAIRWTSARGRSSGPATATTAPSISSPAFSFFSFVSFRKRE